MTQHASYGPVHGPPTGEISRRGFMRRMLGVGMGLLSLEFLGGTLAFLWPNLTEGLGAEISLGSAERHQQPSGRSGPTGCRTSTTRRTSSSSTCRQPRRGSRAMATVAEPIPDPGRGRRPTSCRWRSARCVALYRKCPHLGCQVPQLCEPSQWFECLCHGSKYTILGEKRDGPAPRGMDRFEVTVADGAYVIDTARDRVGGPPPGTVTFDDRAADRHAALHAADRCASSRSASSSSPSLAAVHDALLVHRRRAPRRDRAQHQEEELARTTARSSSATTTTEPAAAGCARCHGADGTGGAIPNDPDGRQAPSLHTAALANKLQVNPNYVHLAVSYGGVVVSGNVNSPMPAWSAEVGGPLNVQQIEAVVALVTELGGGGRRGGPGGGARHASRPEPRSSPRPAAPAATAPSSRVARRAEHLDDRLRTGRPDRLRRRRRASSR